MRCKDDKAAGKMRKQSRFYIFLLLAFCIPEPGFGLDVRFDDPTSGFFLREEASAASSNAVQATNDVNLATDDKMLQPTTSIMLGVNTKLPDPQLFGAAAEATDVFHSAGFTVLKSSQPVTVRATYGPFMSSQMVPTQYMVPDLWEEPSQESRRPGLITHFQPHQIDLSAHLVTSSISKSSPVLRVLYHTGLHQRAPSSSRSQPFRPLTTGSHSQICVLTAVTMEKAGTWKMSNQSQSKDNRDTQTKVLSSVCSPKGLDGTCLGEITVPASWWPSVTAMAASSNAQDTSKSPIKHPTVKVKVSYSVYETSSPSCQVEPASRVPVIPETQIGSVSLVFPKRGNRQLAKDEILHMLLPQEPIYPNSKMYVPVFLEQPKSVDRGGPISAITIKCRTRAGFRLEGVEATSRRWTVHAEMNSRNTIATVSAFKNNLQTTQGTAKVSSAMDQDSEVEGPEEIFNWLLTLDGDAWKHGRIIWYVKYQRAAARTHRFPSERDAALMDDQAQPEEQHHSGENATLETFFEDDYFDINRYQMGIKMTIQKDDVQSVIPVSKHSEMMNLAVLTGNQISKPLKVFIVSHMGEVADVTLNSLCSSKDQSVLKVSASCTSIYVDGSETAGALNARIVVKYDDKVANADFTVWMPDLPLSMDVGDTKLSQIKGWKVKQDTELARSSGGNVGKRSNAAPDAEKLNVTAENDDPDGPEDHCRLRYQQTRIRVFGKFLAQDADSGRKEYFPTRGYELDLTELLTGKSLRIADPKVAQMSGNVVQGLSPGRTEVQVVSPITGNKLASREIKVVKSKESIKALRMRVLTGLRLKVQADQVRHQRARFSLTTAYSHVLTTKYQEGLLDLELQFTDDTVLPLRDVSTEDYYLSVTSLEPKIIAFAPSRETRYPRVIALSSGKGKLLRVSMELMDGCLDRTSSNLPLASGDVDVSVEISNQKKKDSAVDWSRYSTAVSSIADLAEGGVQDDQSYYNAKSGGGPVTTIQSGSTAVRENGDRRMHRLYPSHMSPLEIGMYILLAVFCAAMAIFVASCFVYASKYGRRDYQVQLQPSPLTSRSIQNAHDWVWLGKQSMADSTFDSRINIIPNPGSLDLNQDMEVVSLPLPNMSRDHRRAAGPCQSSNPDLICYGPYQRQHRHHQQLLMQRPHRFLPAPPIHRHRHQRVAAAEPDVAIRPICHIDSTTYTKKMQQPRSLALPAVAAAAAAAVGTVSVAHAHEDEDDVVEFVPLRQSPASALPPVLMEEPELGMQGQAAVLGDYESMNPDIEKASPPRLGSQKLLCDPFDLSDEDAEPIMPEKLSPGHVFDSSSIEDILAQMDRKPAAFDSSTFVIRRSLKQQQQQQEPPADEYDGPVALQPEDLASGVLQIHDDEDAEEASDMDYDHLMAYFDNLRESSA